MRKPIALLTLGALCLSSDPVLADWFAQFSRPSDDIFMDVSAPDRSHFFAVGLGDTPPMTLATLAYSTDGGENMVFEHVPVSGLLEIVMAVYFLTPEMGWVGSMGPKEGFLDYQAKLYRLDKMETWTEIDLQAPFGSSVLAVRFLDETHGLVAGDGAYIARTTDGETWDQVEVTITGMPGLKSFTHIKDGPLWLAGGTFEPYDSGTILRSDDGGATFAVQLEGGAFDLLDIDFADDLRGWAVGYNAAHAVVLHTQDGGQTWTRQELPPMNGDMLSSVDFFDRLNGVAVGSLGYQALILRTDDGGESWWADEGYTGKMLMKADFPDPNTGWAVGMGPGPVVIKYESDCLGGDPCGTGWACDEELNDCIPLAVDPDGGVDGGADGGVDGGADGGAGDLAVEDQHLTTADIPGRSDHLGEQVPDQAPYQDGSGYWPGEDSAEPDAMPPLDQALPHDDVPAPAEDVQAPAEDSEGVDLNEGDLAQAMDRGQDDTTPGDDVAPSDEDKPLIPLDGTATDQGEPPADSPTLDHDASPVAPDLEGKEAAAGCSC